MAAFLISENELGIWTDILAFDVTLTEQHDSQSVATEYPVEDGAAIVDHVRQAGTTLGLEVLVTNTPVRQSFISLGPKFVRPSALGSLQSVKLDLPIPFDVAARFRGPQLATPGAGTRIAIAAKEGRLVPPVKFAAVLKFPPFDIIPETHNRLLELKDKAQTLRVFTFMREYTNMVLVGVSCARTSEDGESATFALTLQQIRKVSPLTVQAPKVPLDPNGAGKKTRGGAGAKPLEEGAQHEVVKGLAVQAVDGVVNWLGLGG